MPGVAAALFCAADVINKPERLSRSRSGEAQPYRASILPACLRGKRNDEVARVISARPNNAAKWRQRHAAGGLQGLPGELQTGKSDNTVRRFARKAYSCRAAARNLFVALKVATGITRGKFL